MKQLTRRLAIAAYAVAVLLSACSSPQPPAESSPTIAGSANSSSGSTLPPASAAAAPSSMPVATHVATPSVSQRIFADELFDFGKSILKSEGKVKLDDLVSKIKDINLELIIAAGHTDSVGSDAFNQKLSVRRSEAVKAYLVSKGIEKNLVYTEGKGEKQPVANNNPAARYAKNRRVTIEVSGTRILNSINPIKITGNGQEVRSMTPGGLALVCKTSQGMCLIPTPLRTGSECFCADSTGQVGGVVDGNVTQGSKAELSSVVTVLYATDRQQKKSSSSTAFGGERGEIKYGLARVSIPPIHQIGRLEAPCEFEGSEFLCQFIRLRFLEDAQKHALLLELKTLGADEFFRQVQQRARGSTKEDVLVFVHGFNVSFEDAARRTAQIAYDIGFAGAPIFYSWPSQGSPLEYLADSQTIEWTKINLTKFLTDLLSRTDAKNVYLIAHSMGGRALTTAFLSVVNEQPDFKNRIREVILAAPDIDAGIFKRDIAPAMTKIGLPITLYASSEDILLKESHLANHYARAGDSGSGLVLLAGIETIDATLVDTSLFGHSYYSNSRALLSDLQYLINQDLRATQRSGLRQLSGDRPYWELKP
jgi:esterase/lipase superfamily enzyme/outer membrane protein OmpA-like peptidoglycan-associated protein